jgi:hypothetical protein
MRHSHRCPFASRRTPSAALNPAQVRLLHKTPPGCTPEGDCDKIAFVFPIRYTTQPGYGIHGMPGNLDTAVQQQHVGGIFQGDDSARILGLVRYVLG